jgi:hypothetical protein
MATRLRSLRPWSKGRCFHESLCKKGFVGVTGNTKEGLATHDAVDPFERIREQYSIHLRRKARKDGSIMFMGKKWSIGYPEGTPVTICLIPNLKFMVYKEDKKIWEVHL